MGQGEGQRQEEAEAEDLNWNNNWNFVVSRLFSSPPPHFIWVICAKLVHLPSQDVKIQILCLKVFTVSKIISYMLNLKKTIYIIYIVYGSFDFFLLVDIPIKS